MNIKFPISYHIKHIHSLINSSSKAHHLTTSNNIIISHLISYLQPSTTPNYHLGSIGIHTTLLILHKAHISSYAYNSTNLHRSYISHKLLPNQLNNYTLSFQKFRQINHQQLKSPSFTNAHIHQVTYSSMTRLTNYQVHAMFKTLLDACGTN